MRYRVAVYQYLTLEGETNRYCEAVRRFHWKWQVKEFMRKYDQRCFEFVVSYPSDWSEEC